MFAAFNPTDQMGAEFEFVGGIYVHFYSKVCECVILVYVCLANERNGLEWPRMGGRLWDQFRSV